MSIPATLGKAFWNYMNTCIKGTEQEDQAEQEISYDVAACRIDFDDRARLEKASAEPNDRRLCHSFLLCRSAGLFLAKASRYR